MSEIKEKKNLELIFEKKNIDTSDFSTNSDLQNLDKWTFGLLIGKQYRKNDGKGGIKLQNVLLSKINKFCYQTRMTGYFEVKTLETMQH